MCPSQLAGAVLLEAGLGTVAALGCFIDASDSDYSGYSSAAGSLALLAVLLEVSPGSPARDVR